MIQILSCPKGYTMDQDKANSPADTLRRVREQLKKSHLDILASIRRVDTGRLGIPVFLSMCGGDAQKIMPTRKQMGKGASKEQAEASALMELMERFAFFSFWEQLPNMVEATWSEAEQRFGAACLPLADMLQSVNEKNCTEQQARAMLDLVSWKFMPVTEFSKNPDGTPHTLERWIPLDWFRALGEFNGSSAGNTDVESLLQGACELVERHVCCIIDRSKPCLPSIATSTIQHPVLVRLIDAFRREGIHLVLKDFSLNMPVPTVAAIAWDEKTFPELSEIVYTAGTASSPEKAAIRAITEIAQLAGDFCTGACYEASGLSKYENLADIDWLLQGEIVSLRTLPTIERTDIRDEYFELCRALHTLGYPVYALATTHPELQIPAHYSIIPGLQFRERDKNASLGLFIGRILSESSPQIALAGLEKLEKITPNAHYIPFFKGILALRAEDMPRAHTCFLAAEPRQPEPDSQALTAFYAAYTHTMAQEWAKALPHLDRAIQACPGMKEYFNLRGVCAFKLQHYAQAAEDFRAVLHLDKGSALDRANLGLCLKYLGQNSEAREMLATALELDPSLDFARAHLEECEPL